jgi:DNA-binding MarR family transcriptional regulator
MGAWWGAVQAMRHRVGPFLERQHGLDFKHFIVLHSIELGAKYPGALCERLEVTPSGISKMLDDLSRRGLISRSLDDEDSRRVRLAVTPEGEAVLLGARDAIFGLLDDALAGEEPEHVAAFTRFLERLQQGVPQSFTPTQEARS